MHYNFVVFLSIIVYTEFLVVRKLEFVSLIIVPHMFRWLVKVSLDQTLKQRAKNSKVCMYKLIYWYY